MHNLILDTDSYKASHYLQYPKNTEYLSCYIESRGGKFESTLFFGLQMFLKKYFCRAITKESRACLCLHEQSWLTDWQAR